MLITTMLSSLDDEFGEDFGLSLDDVPGLLNFTLRYFRKKWEFANFFATRAFVFRPEYQRVAQLVLNRAKKDKFEKEKRKKRKKKSTQKLDVTFVGIHNRRGDHIQYQKEVNFLP